MQSGASGGRPQRAGMHAKNAGMKVHHTVVHTLEDCLNKSTRLGFKTFSQPLND